MATPTIQDIFEMRKQGKFEEAYNKVLPLYREHYGHYTTLCMFWTATDVCNLRMKEHKFDEAATILTNLVAIYPNLQDHDKTALRTLHRLHNTLVMCGQGQDTCSDFFAETYKLLHK